MAIPLCSLSMPEETELLWMFSVGFLVLIGSMVFETLNNAAARSRDYPDPFVRLPPRPPTGWGQALLQSQLILVAVIAAFVALVDPVAADYGFKPLGGYWPIAFAAGVAIYFGFVHLYGLVVRLLGVHDALAAAAYVGMRSIWPRAGRGHRSLYAGLALNPFTEELLFRGFLVYYMGNVSGSPVAFFLIGLAACLAVHVYQGGQLLWFHGAFYVLAVLLLYSPLGIVGAFGMHFVGDFYPFKSMTAQRAAYRKLRRIHRPIAK